MKRYKVISTLIWQFDCDGDYDSCMEMAQQQLERIACCDPHGEDYEGFNVQIDLAPMKDRKKMEHIKEYDMFEIFSYITKDEERIAFVVDGVSYMVRMNSDRYVLFKRNPNCVACGLKGTRMYLDLNPGDNSPHFNLYGEENGRMILMTKDHIVPKSKGGEDVLHNYQTMCSVCNNLKGNYDLMIDDICELRKLNENPNKLPRKDLKNLINTKREELAAPLTIIIGSFYE
jgi:hypothetical protein